MRLEKPKKEHVPSFVCLIYTCKKFVYQIFNSTALLKLRNNNIIFFGFLHQILLVSMMKLK